MAKVRYLVATSGGGGSGGNVYGNSTTVSLVPGANVVTYSLSGGRTAKIVQFYIAGIFQPGGFQYTITSSTVITVTSPDSYASVTLNIIGF